MVDITDNYNIPKHVAVIMDGNGRWAKARNLPRSMGHKKGADAARNIVSNAAKAGVKYLTLFGFSSENWNRPEEEIQELMKLLRHFLRSQTAEFHKNNARLSVIGDRSEFDGDIIKLIDNAESLTKDNDAIHVVIALNYGGRSDIAQATHKLLEVAVVAGEAPDLGAVEGLLADNLLTKNIPDPDLLIRTSGEQRISNFLLWQCAYAEMVFTDVLWPDFGAKELQSALDEYSSRDRRYGAISKKQSEV